MKKVLQLFSFILVLSFLISACKKNSVEEIYTETVHPVVPDLSTQINASVEGFVTDQNGDAVEAAEIKAGTGIASTNAYGYFRIANVSLAKDAGFIKVTKAGYFTGFRTFLPRSGKQAFVRLQLIPKTNSGTIDAGTGGSITTPDAASVALPSNGVVISSNNTPYAGPVNVSVHWLNPIDVPTTQLNMPGDLRGIDSEGYLNTLTTYGMLAVELTSDAGELLQIAAGKKASLSFPIPASILGNAPATIPLWYFNESNGLWEEDGSAVKNGNYYTGDVSHFTWWNCDIPSGTVNFSMQLLDMSLAPLSNTAVTITANGEQNSTRTNYTDANGEIYGAIPANSNITVSVASLCTPSVLLYSQTITTTNVAVDMGSVKINPAESGAILKGFVKNCSGAPVTDGYVIISAGRSTKVVEIVNGDFITSSVICPNLVAGIIAYDRSTSEQSILHSATLVSGENNFDTLQACAPVSTETISYELDGAGTTYALPYQDFQGAFDLPSLSTTISATDWITGSAVFYVSFPGSDSPGTYPVSGNIKLGAVTYSIVGASSISISNYGLVGEFINASIIGWTINDGVDHTFNCNITIRRDN